MRGSHGIFERYYKSVKYYIQEEQSHVKHHRNQEIDPEERVTVARRDVPLPLVRLVMPVMNERGKGTETYPHSVMPFLMSRAGKSSSLSILIAVICICVTVTGNSRI